MENTLPQALQQATDAWRSTHMGRLLGEALRRFDGRVQELMAHSADAPLQLANLAARGKISAAILHITRHLDPTGTRLTTLAQRAGMSKQAMTTLVSECEAWGIVQREADALDARAKLVRFTPLGLQWLAAFEQAVRQAQRELSQEVGEQIAQVMALGLEAYARGYETGI
ncbi:MAG: MarR family transcriptional regulator [Brachymonas sp.]|nr:MarR family transcriptional regulator [Brachymonas sp.]